MRRRAPLQVSLIQREVFDAEAFLGPGFAEPFGRQRGRVRAPQNDEDEGECLSLSHPESLQ